MQAHHLASAAPDAPRCPLHAVPTAQATLAPHDELVLPLHWRTVTQMAQTADGATALRLYHGDKEITFDEPELFAFGQGLAQQSRFAAGTATTWGPAYSWQQLQPLLTQLLDAGCLNAHPK